MTDNLNSQEDVEESLHEVQNLLARHKRVEAGFHPIRKRKSC